MVCYSMILKFYALHVKNKIAVDSFHKFTISKMDIAYIKRYCKVLIRFVFKFVKG
jgi:hypothetical protein